MGKFLYLTVAGWVMLSVFTLSAQVTISPAIGISVIPFQFFGANTRFSSRKADLLLGISAQLPVKERWYFNTRISYADRVNWTWQDLCTCPGYVYSRYEQSDLNLDFTLNHMLNDYLDIGVGPAIIRKINTTITIFDTGIDPAPITFSEERFEYGIQATASLTVRFLKLRLEYARKLYNYKLDLFAARGNNRYNAVVAVPIRLKKRQR